uniref:Uncharacterized protein n=1 Tax=Aquilaria malaccensis TaxID=223753 RepID=A0A4Y6GLN8_9ROSI|nr:hypothetical protein [Aquilaria malaccensis]
MQKVKVNVKIGQIFFSSFLIFALNSNISSKMRLKDKYIIISQTQSNWFEIHGHLGEGQRFKSCLC